MKFKNPSFNFFLTEVCTHKHAETNMLPLFQSWGHKNRGGGGVAPEGARMKALAPSHVFCL